MKNRSVCLGLAGVFTLFLVGCGGGDGADGIIGTGANEPIKLVGAAQKGPYLKGSQVLLSRLLADGTPSPETTRTEIEDDLGNFRYSVTQTGPVLISADGYHFNELTGKLSQNRLQLNAVYNVTDATEQHSYVNILTHLAYKRALKLIREGKAVDDAIHQAESEVLTAFNPVLPVSGIRDFTQLNLFDLDSTKAAGNAYVLALSATIYEYATQQVRKDPDVPLDSQLAALLNGLADDLSDDGTISRADVLTGLKDATRLLRPDEIRKNLENRSFVATSEKLPVANIDRFIDTDGDGQANNVDTDDDNDGIEDELDVSPYVYSEAPALTKPDITHPIATNEDVTFEWHMSEYAKSIEIVISIKEDFSEPTASMIVESNSFTKRFGAAGVYYMKTRARNALGSWGEWSNPVSLSVGVWSKHFGGTGEEYATKIIASQTGGSIVLGKTNSHEISTNVDPNGDDWIFKVDHNGEILWQYVSHAGGPERFNDIAELSDGSIVAVGEDWNSNKAAMLKLDSSGRKTIELLYRPDTISDKYDFLNVVEIKNKLYVSAAQWGPSGCAGCTQRSAYYIHTFDPITNTVSESISLPALDGVVKAGIRILTKTSDDNLLIAGDATPTGESALQYANRVAYLLQVDTNLKVVTQWNNVGNDFCAYFQRNLHDVTELSDRRFAFIGQSSHGLAITIVSPNGSEFTKYVNTGYSSFSSSIVSTQNGGLASLLSRRYEDSPTLVSFDTILSEAGMTSLVEFQEIQRLAGFTHNNDGTFTLPFSVGPSGNSNRDIVLVRRNI